MSVFLYYTNSSGDLVLASDRVRLGTLELNMQATECAVGTSQIVVDDPDGDFYTPGHRPLYVVETEAWTDDFLGIIGVFWTWNRQVRRGPYRNGAGREVVINVKDLNTLLTMRVQKGADSERDQENDVERIVEWLSNTAEVIGGFGDNGFSIDEREFMFTDSPIQMSETDYTGQDSAGVINDALQDSGKTAWLYNRASAPSNMPIRVGMWYGHTDRTNFTSAHSISNDLDDVDIDPAVAAATMSSATLLAGTWTFAPSIDAELDRDPSRQVTGAMVQWDGGSTYVSQSQPSNLLTHRDMVFAAELVKNAAQATQRGNSYLNRLENEDDAITCAVLVPPALVNGFHQGMRVPVRFTHFGPEGYAVDPINMRIAARTVRQTDTGLYEIALDLRGESRPVAGPTPPGETPTSYNENLHAKLGGSSGPYPLPSGEILWDRNLSQSGFPWYTTNGPFQYVASSRTWPPWFGIRVTSTGFLQKVTLRAEAIGVGRGDQAPYTITWDLMQNDVVLATISEQFTPDGNSQVYGGGPFVIAYDVPVTSGDVLSGRLSCIGSTGAAMPFFRTPLGVNAGQNYLWIEGGSF